MGPCFLRGSRGVAVCAGLVLGFSGSAGWLQAGESQLAPSLLGSALVFPRQFERETLREERDPEDRLKLRLEKSQEQRSSSAPVVTVHRLTEFLGVGKGFRASEWENGVPRGLAIRQEPGGARIFSKFSGDPQMKASSFDQPLSEELFSEQVHTFTEGGDRLDVTYRREKGQPWKEVARQRTPIRPSHSAQSAPQSGGA
jgi:hypothetical protein